MTTPYDEGTPEQARERADTIMLDFAQNLLKEAENISPREAAVNKFYDEVLDAVNNAVVTGNLDNSLSAELERLRFQLLEDLA